MTYLIGQLPETTQRIGAPLIVVNFPGLERRNDLSEIEGPPAELMGPLCDGIILLDLTDAVRTYHQDPTALLFVFDKDKHRNEHGHRLIAEHVQDALAAQGTP